MNLFQVFAPIFLEWPLAIARELNTRRPHITFSGLATGPRGIYDRVMASKNPKISPLSWLDDLERKWLVSPCDDERLAKYEKMLGAGVVKKIVISDRQIGVGFQNGGLIPRTELMNIAKNSEMVRRYVLGLLDSIFESFEQNRPNLVFCYGVAGALTFALGKICDHLAIPFARLNPSRVGTEHIIDDSPEGLLGPVKKVFEQAVHNPNLLKDTLPTARDYLERFRVKQEKPEFATYVHERYTRSYSFVNITRQTINDVLKVAYAFVHKKKQALRTPTQWHRGVYNLRVGLRMRRLSRNALFLPVGSLPTRPFVYFPLHVDPEATTMVAAPMHTDQIAVIEALAKSLPLGMNLIVKEHIPMLGRRPNGFYQRIKNMSGVFLASPYENTFSLIKQALLTCVITGTAGLEAMLLQRPILIIGNAPYIAVGKGFVYCPDLSSLAEAISEALVTPPADDDRLVLYLAAIIDQSFGFPTELFWGTVTEEIPQQNQEILINICDRILAMMERRDSSREA